MRLVRSPRTLVMLAMLCWAGNWVVGRAMRAELPPFALNFWRWALALCVLLPLAWPRLAVQWPLLRRHWRFIVGMSALSTTAFQSMVYLGLQSTEALNGALINATVPVFIAGTAWLLYRQPTSARQFAGIAVSLLGVAVIVSRGDLARLAALRFNPGDLWLLAAMPVWSLYTVLLRRAPQGLDRMVFVAALAAVGVALQLPLYGLELASGRHLVPTLGAFAALAYVAVFATVVAYLLYNTALETIHPTAAGLLHHTHPLFTAGLAMLFLGERPAAFHLAGLAGIALGVWLTTAATPAPAG